MKVYAWLIDLIHRRKNCPTGMISGWVQKVTEHRGTIPVLVLKRWTTWTSEMIITVSSAIRNGCRVSVCAWRLTRRRGRQRKVRRRRRGLRVRGVRFAGGDFVSRRSRLLLLIQQSLQSRQDWRQVHQSATTARVRRGARIAVSTALVRNGLGHVTGDGIRVGFMKIIVQIDAANSGMKLWQGSSDWSVLW